MDELVIKGTERLKENGIEVLYAENANNALEYIYSIVNGHEIVAKSKSNTAGEIGLTNSRREWCRGD